MYMYMKVQRADKCLQDVSLIVCNLHTVHCIKDKIVEFILSPVYPLFEGSTIYCIPLLKCHVPLHDISMSA